MDILYVYRLTIKIYYGLSWYWDWYIIFIMQAYCNNQDFNKYLASPRVRTCEPQSSLSELGWNLLAVSYTCNYHKKLKYQFTCHQIENQTEKMI